MARNKSKDPNGPHSRIYHSLHDAPAFRVLSGNAVKLFLDLRRGLTGTNNGNLSATLSDLKHRGWTSSQTLSRALYQLRALGFIAVTREGGLKQGTRICTLYRFTDLVVYEQPKVGVQHCKATHDYLQYRSVKEVEHALETGLEKLRQEGAQKQIPQKKSPVPKRNRISSKTEPMGRIYRFRNGTGGCSISSETEQGEMR